MILEALKSRYNRAKRSNLFFYRDSNGNEVDLIYTLANRFVAVEIKAGETVSRQFFTSLSKLRELLPEQIAGEVLVYGGDSPQVRHRVRVTFPRAFRQVLEAMESELIEACG